MSWTYDEITKDWLGPSVIAVPPEEVVAAFERCEHVLGRDWINQSRGTFTTGAAPTLHVVITGQRLASLDGIAATDSLVSKLAKGDSSAGAELHAIHLLRSGGGTAVELFPKVNVGNNEKEPDLQVRRGDDHPWTYVEVTQPDVSGAHERASAVLNMLTGVIEAIARPFDLEVFLRREPVDEEVNSMLSEILSFSAATESGRKELRCGLGLLFLRGAPSGPVTTDDHGEEPLPRIGRATVKVENGVPTRRVIVRMPYADGRAAKMLSREAKQLPEEGPGLVMVDMSNAPGGFSSWEPIIRRRLHPAQHTRIGGVCLFSAGTLLTERGFAVLSQTKFLTHHHAKAPLAPWIEATLFAAGDEYRAMGVQTVKTTAPFDNRQ